MLAVAEALGGGALGHDGGAIEEQADEPQQDADDEVEQAPHGLLYWMQTVPGLARDCSPSSAARSTGWEQAPATWPTRKEGIPHQGRGSRRCPV